MTLDELEALVASIDPERGTVTKSRFDGGYTIRVYLPGFGPLAATYEWGDEELGVMDPIDKLAQTIRERVA
jgi:hypothetical protein